MRTIILATLLAGAAPAFAQTATTGDTIVLRNNALTVVNAAAPGTVVRRVPITGLATGANILSIDTRNKFRRILYGLTDQGTVVGINSVTGQTRIVGNAGANVIEGITGQPTIAFNGASDRIRIVSTSGLNLAVNPDSAAVTTGTPLAYVIGDSGGGVTPRVTAAAYTSPVGGATTLYAFDNARNQLVQVGSVNGTPVGPGSGQLTTVSQINVATTDATRCASLTKARCTRPSPTR